MASTISPRLTVKQRSERGGNMRSPFADIMLRSRLLTCRPVLSAQGIGSFGSQRRWTRWYSGRGSSLTSKDN